MVLQRRAARHRRREQDPDRQQVRLGGEAGGVDGAGPGPRRRARRPVPRGLRQEQHQRREGLLQPRGRHQEAHDRHVQVGSGRVAGRQRGGSEG